MAPLEPPMASSQSWPKDACALACSSHCVWSRTILFLCSYHLLTCLFSCGPKSLRDVCGQCTAAEGSRFSILGDLDGLELVHPDRNSALHPSNCADGPMAAIDGKERDIALSGEFHLERSKICAPSGLNKDNLNIHTISATSLSVPGTTTTLMVGVSYDDHRAVAKSKAVVSFG